MLTLFYFNTRQLLALRYKNIHIISHRKSSQFALFGSFSGRNMRCKCSELSSLAQRVQLYATPWVIYMVWGSDSIPSLLSLFQCLFYLYGCTVLCRAVLLYDTEMLYITVLCVNMLLNITVVHCCTVTTVLLLCT
jgi:hypothetical protein